MMVALVVQKAWVGPAGVAGVEGHQCSGLGAEEIVQRLDQGDSVGFYFLPCQKHMDD